MATYYVRSSGGSDGNDGLSFANGWATIQFAADTVAAGDVILICADGTHLPTATITIDTTSGTEANPIQIRGAAADGTDDGTIATISGASLPGSSNLMTAANGVDLWSYSNLILDGASSNGFAMPTDGHGSHTFNNVTFSNNASNGFSVGAWSNSTSFLNCTFSGNGSVGLYSSQNPTTLIECVFYDNGSYGFFGWSSAFSCIFALNGSHGFYMDDWFDMTMQIYACTFYGNTGSGIYCNPADAAYQPILFQTIIEKNILSSNGAYGIHDVSNSRWERITFNYNCTYNNTSGACNFNSGVVPGTGNVTSNPNFVNTGVGTEDFTPQETGLAITRDTGMGVDHAYIGAIQPQRISSTGGGLLIHPGMTGGISG